MSSKTRADPDNFPEVEDDKKRAVETHYRDTLSESFPTTYA